MPPPTCTKKARPAPGKTSPLSLGPPWPPSPASPGPSGSNALTLSPSQPWSPVHTQAPSRLAHGCQPMPEHPAKVPCPPLPRAVPPQLLPLHPPFLGLWLKALYSVFPAWSIISCLVTHDSKCRPFSLRGAASESLLQAPSLRGGTSPHLYTALALLLRKPPLVTPGIQLAGGRICRSHAGG